MVIDSSALVAILLREPERDAFVEAIAADRVRICSAPTLFETGIVIDSLRGAAGASELRMLMSRAAIQPASFGPEHAELAIEAFRRFGKGRHPAGLNFGDCFSYALAKATNEPLLFKGNDFVRTDVRRVL